MKKFWDYALIFIPILLAGLVSMMVDFGIYKDLNLPSLAPPAVLFPIMWSILYILMGISLYLNRDNKYNMMVFWIQLAINYLWVFMFFGFEMFLGSFIVIILLAILILYTILEFYKHNKASAYMLIPYLLWTMFASYLNWQIFVLN